MCKWIDVTSEGNLLDGEHLIINVEGIEVAVFRMGTEYYAIQDICTHDGTPIALGHCSDGEIICPRHGARFCLKTGRALSPPAYEDIRTYPIRIKGGLIQVGEPS